jgi:hypothetical protein
MGEDANSFLGVEEKLLYDKTVGANGGLEMFTRPEIEGSVMRVFDLSYPRDDPWVVDSLDTEDKVEKEEKISLSKATSFCGYLLGLVIKRPHHKLITDGGVVVLI